MRVVSKWRCSRSTSRNLNVERCIIWDAPAIAINWSVKQAQISEKDQQEISPNNNEVPT